MSADKTFTLKLNNGKEESFHTGEEMYNWFIKQTGLRKKKTKHKNKKISEILESEIN